MKNLKIKIKKEKSNARDSRYVKDQPNWKSILRLPTRFNNRFESADDEGDHRVSFSLNRVLLPPNYFFPGHYRTAFWCNKRCSPETTTILFSSLFLSYYRLIIFSALSLASCFLVVVLDLFGRIAGIKQRWWLRLSDKYKIKKGTEPEWERRIRKMV